MKSSNTNEELAYFDECLHAATKYLEFGSGNSTTRAVKQEGLQIISVESDSEYLDDFKIFISTITKKSLSLEFIHADIGPTEELGYPEESTEKAILLNYTNWVWDKLKFKSFIPDLILIDGRFRVATFLMALIHSPGAKVIFDDYMNREHYKVIEEILPRKYSVGRFGVFVVPLEFTPEIRLRMVTMLEKYSMIPS